MVLTQMTAGGGVYVLSLAVIISAVYLAVVRFMDLNEKEPLWAMGLVFSLGAVAAFVLPLVVNPVILELNTLWGAVSEEPAKFAAFAFGAALLAAVAG